MVERRDDGRVADAMQELDALLHGIGEKLAVSSEPSGVSAAPARSGTLYRTITRYWPRIAAGLVGFALVLDFFVGNLAAEGGLLEFYVFAWASTTGGLWFLFEKAEKALSEESRDTVVGWVREADFKSGIESISAQFATLFDKLFGERHLSRRCFARSCVASLITTMLLIAAWLTSRLPRFYGVAMESSQGQPFTELGDTEALLGTVVESLDISGLGSTGLMVLSAVVVLNFLPDFASLWETRLLVAWARKQRSLWTLLLVDALFTATLSFAWVVGVGTATGLYRPPPRPEEYTARTLHWVREATWFDDNVAWRGGPPLRTKFDVEPASIEPIVAAIEAAPDEGVLFISGGSDRSVRPGRGLVQLYQAGGWGDFVSTPLATFFYSAFFTSIWLWLYVASILVSRLLLRMNNGVGFLLRVTDVERQPFRSLGFVSVIIASVIFALGLPLVLF